MGWQLGKWNCLKSLLGRAKWIKMEDTEVGPPPLPSTTAGEWEETVNSRNMALEEQEGPACITGLGHQGFSEQINSAGVLRSWNLQKAMNLGRRVGLLPHWHLLEELGLLSRFRGQGMCHQPRTGIAISPSAKPLAVTSLPLVLAPPDQV